MAQEKETSRLEAFSDGVFAIAITLLVLELKVPHAESKAALASELAAEWPSYFAFVSSFATILVMWVHHHMIFRLVRHSDTRLLFANGLLLMLVTSVPFPTALLAEYLTTPAAPTAVTVYAGVFVGIAIAFHVVIMAAFRKSTLDPAASEATVLHLRRSYRLGPPLYLTAAIAGPFVPWLAMTICTGLWIFWAATTREC
jgi:TMEM175 potassium channel family protein